MGSIIRTCSGAALTILLAGEAAARAAPSPLASYARGRLAVQPQQASESFAIALTAAPTETTVSLRAYRAAIVTGDYALALRAAQALDAAASAPAEARLLFFVAALKSRDQHGAADWLTEIARDRSLAFLAHPLAEWLRLGNRVPVMLPDIKGIANSTAYDQENAALVALARGEIEAGSDAVKTLWTLDPYRAQSLRLTAAATLAARKARGPAQALLIAETRTTVAAKERITAGKLLPIATDTPLKGTAFLLARLAGDLTAEGSGLGAVTLARIAQFADPENPRIALIVAGALKASGRNAAALSVIDRLLRDPLYGDDAASLRIDVLEALGRLDEARDAAIARALRSANDTARLGDLAMRRRDYAEAATWFGMASELSGREGNWQYQLAAGNAYLLAGEWDAAQSQLEVALKAAPDEPQVLNALGFGLVSVGGDPMRGKALIERAAALNPGNAAIIDSQGWAAYKTGDFPQAVRFLERAQRLEPSQAEIADHLGDAYWAVGRKIEARYTWEAARVAADPAQATHLLAKIANGLP